jgi:hypothetical protein
MFHTVSHFAMPRDQGAFIILRIDYGRESSIAT